MQENKTYKMVGLFVIIGFLAFSGIVYHYISRKFITDESKLVIMYFEESIQGLSVGSPVVFKGVEVGKVARIRLLTNLRDGTFKMPVYVKFSDKKSEHFGYNEVSDQTVLLSLIEKGLRARLISSNYLTGQLMVELDMDPNAPAIMRGTGEYMEIPTIISSIGMISKDLQEIPFRENMMQLGNLLREMDNNLPSILQNLEKITAKIDNILEIKSEETSAVINNVNSTLEDMGRASKSIQNLTDYLERHPEALIQGKREGR